VPSRLTAGITLPAPLYKDARGIRRKRCLAPVRHGPCCDHDEILIVVRNHPRTADAKPRVHRVAVWHDVFITRWPPGRDEPIDVAPHPRAYDLVVLPCCCTCQQSPHESDQSWYSWNGPALHFHLALPPAQLVEQAFSVTG